MSLVQLKWGVLQVISAVLGGPKFKKLKFCGFSFLFLFFSEKLFKCFILFSEETNCSGFSVNLMQLKFKKDP